MSSLTGKVALVTGGSRGIGAAIAKRLAADGATVALTYVNGEKAAETVVAAIVESGGKALALRADSAKPEDVEGAVSATAEAFGRVDILVNNAGIFQAGPVEALSTADFDRTFAVNVRAAFVAARAALSVMPDGGRIISIGSNLALRAPSPGLSLYTASKAAVAGLSLALARELGPRGITVNTVHPGSTNTDMNPEDGAHAGQQRSLMAGDKGFADPSEIAGVVAYLASPAAGSVTGAAWTIDSGANI
jgi:NAD(P)-dependent dehydrogenase (short-subunit alcohol dehydrogenase family)